MIEEETNPKDTIERLPTLILQEKVDCIQGLISTGVSLGVGPVAEEEQALTVMWDGTTQDGVKEMMPNSKYVFRSTDNECEAVMGSLLAVKHFKGKFKRVAGINPDYSYGRNNLEAFAPILARFGIEAEFVAEQWPKVGTMDLTSHIAALKAAKPDLIFSSMLFADLPVFMKQGHAAGLFEGIKMVLPAAGWQINQLKKEFTPEGIIFGHNTLYFDHPAGLRRCRRRSCRTTWTSYKEAPHWEADRAYFAMATYKAGVEAAQKAGRQLADAGPRRRSDARPRGRKPRRQGPLPQGQDRRAGVLPGAVHQQQQVRFPRPWPRSTPCTRPTCKSRPGADFWEWIKTAH